MTQINIQWSDKLDLSRAFWMSSTKKLIETAICNFCSNPEYSIIKIDTSHDINFVCLATIKNDIVASFSRSKKSAADHIYFKVNVNDFINPIIIYLQYNMYKFKKNALNDTQCFYETNDVVAKCINRHLCAKNLNLDFKIFIYFYNEWHYLVIDRQSQLIKQFVGLETKEKEVGHVWKYLKSIYDIEKFVTNSAKGRIS